jgi:uncharacterized protein YjcR
MAKRFTDAQKQAALADLKDGMTLEQAAKKHKCSANSLIQWKKALGASAKAAVKRTPAKNVSSSAISSVKANRLMDLEDQKRAGRVGPLGRTKSNIAFMAPGLDNRVRPTRAE